MEDQPDDPGPKDSLLARLDAKLSRAVVAASSPKGIVKVVYNGHGDGVSMELKTGAKRGYEPETMAGFATAALRAADRALDALHQHAFTDLDVHGGSLAEYRAARPTAAADIARCFGRTG